MRRYLIPMAAASLVLVLVGCSTTKPPATTTGASVPVAETVWSDNLSTKGYEDWMPAPGFESMQPAKGPHGKSVKVFVDPIMDKARAGSGETAWPTGSMIVKEAYDAAGALTQLEYMQRTADGWYYASFGTDGKVVKEGVKVAPCQPCHAKGTDSVISVKLPQ